MPKLKNPRHEAVCQEYIKDLNQTAAYSRVYGKKSTENTTEAAASRLFSNVKVKQRIEELMQKREKRTQVSQDYVVKKLLEITESDITDVMNINSNGVSFKDIESLPKEIKSTIQSVSENIRMDGGGTQGLKLHDKMKALELLGRHLGMFKDKVEMEVTSHKSIIDELTEDE